MKDESEGLVEWLRIVSAKRLLFLISVVLPLVVYGSVNTVDSSDPIHLELIIDGNGTMVFNQSGSEQAPLRRKTQPPEFREVGVFTLSDLDLPSAEELRISFVGDLLMIGSQKTLTLYKTGFDDEGIIKLDLDNTYQYDPPFDVKSILCRIYDDYFLEVGSNFADLRSSDDTYIRSHTLSYLKTRWYRDPDMRLHSDKCLRNSKKSIAGVVQIRENKDRPWESICKDGLGFDVANNICLRLTGYNDSTTLSSVDENTGCEPPDEFKVGNVSCVGSEKGISQCFQSNLTTHCAPGDAAYISCPVHSKPVECTESECTIIEVSKDILNIIYTINNRKPIALKNPQDNTQIAYMNGKDWILVANGTQLQFLNINNTISDSEATLPNVTDSGMTVLNIQGVGMAGNSGSDLVYLLTSDSHIVKLRINSTRNNFFVEARQEIQMSDPAGIGVDSKGNIYVYNNKLIRSYVENAPLETGSTAILSVLEVNEILSPQPSPPQDEAVLVHLILGGGCIIIFVFVIHCIFSTW